MPKVYVLNAPEFAGLIESARKHGGYAIGDAGANYTSIEAEGELLFDRRAAGLHPALWYAALAGGMDGEISEFGRDRLRLVDCSKS